MKTLLFMVILFSSVSAFGQTFKFYYTSMGLGSNRRHPPRLIVTVSDTTLTYFILEGEKKAEIDSVSKDTVWKEIHTPHKVLFPRKSITKVIKLLANKKNQYLFISNPNIMSGWIQNIYIEYESWCTEISLKNTSEPTSAQIMSIINKYLPKLHKIHSFREGFKAFDGPPLIKKCPSDSSKSYVDYLGEEYEYIRQKRD